MNQKIINVSIKYDYGFNYIIEKNVLWCYNFVANLKNNKWCLKCLALEVTLVVIRNV